MKNATNTPTVKNGPGRPRAKITIPNRNRFSFADLAEANKHVTELTLRKFLKRDAARKNKSEVVLIKGEFGKPDSKDGLGRKPFLFAPRSKAGAMKTAAKSTVSVPLANKPAKKAKSAAPGADYEATKAAILAPEPTPAPTADIAEPAIG